MKKLTKRQNESIANIDNVLEKELDKEIEELKKLNPVLKKEKNEDIKSMIRYYNNLTHEIENRRTRIHNFTIQMLAIYVTMIGFLLTQYRKVISASILGKIIFIEIIIVLSIQIVLNLISIFIYEKQSAYRYPFSNLDKYGNQWKWFYYGNKETLKINTDIVSEPSATIKPYLQSLKNFVDNYRKEDLNSELVSNIKQLHLLMVHNYYKNQFYLKLTYFQKKSAELWLISIICIILASIIIYFLNLSTYNKFFIVILYYGIYYCIKFIPLENVKIPFFAILNSINLCLLPSNKS